MKGLTARLLVFNLLLAVFPVGAVLFLGTYEKQLLEAQERAMVQQGRLLASALEGNDLAAEAGSVLERLGGRTDSRLRVVDGNGLLVADSAKPVVGETETETEAPGRREPEAESSLPQESLLYRVGALPTRAFRFLRRNLGPPDPPLGSSEFYSGLARLRGPEIRAALDGRYGAATRISSGGQRSVTLYSAIPVVGEAGVVGAVLVSRSTYAILDDLYRIRLDIVRIFFISVAAAVVLSLLLARTVTVPVGRLRDQAESLVDVRGVLHAPFRPLSGRDEVADLSRSLHTLSSRLKERSTELEEFMADLVHELKNPVAGIISAVDLAEGAPPDEASKLLEVARRESRRIERLLEGSRELVSVDVRLDPEDRRSTDPARIVGEIVDSYPAPPGKELVFHRRIEASESPILNVDPDRFAQAVINLVDNAVSFAPVKTAVEITVEASGKPNRPVGILVSDRGPGLSNPEKAFDRWYSDRTAEDAEYHTGLGLAIAKGIAEGYGGSIRALPRDGGGTTMILEFPLSPPGA